MARLFPPNSHPHLILDVSNRPCAECVVDCDDATCKAQIDDRCTEQCRGVIVPCDDPEHDDIQCPEGKCDSSTCDIPDDCSLLGHGLATCQCETLQHTGISCAQDGCGSTCEPTCDDPDNCSFVDISARIAAEHTYAPHTHTHWDATLDALLCSCGVEFPPHDGIASHNFLRDTTLSTLASPSETSTLHSTFTTSLPHPPCTPPLYLAQPPTPAVLPEHTCLWNNCHAIFSSLDELISHVNVAHLRAHSSQLPEPVVSLASYLRLSSEPLGLPCRWDNCHGYSSTSASSSGDLALDDALNSLAGHLFHDHLGLHEEPGANHNATTINPTTTSSASVILPIPSPDPRQDVEMRDEEQPLDNEQRNIPSDGSAKQDDAIQTMGEQRRSTTREDQTPPPEMGGSRKCCWRGCERSFSSVDGLMNHLTAEHVGSGKNHYECFWRDCERNGEKGFSSKQKVCRHLQMHTGHKPFQCKLCEQHFSEAATLQQHMRRHTQERPYPCDYPGCGKAFAIAGALTIHRRTHMGEKPFKCKFCERAFSESSNLSKHLRTHTGVRPYLCEEPGCGKTFSRPDQFTRHQRVHLKRSRGASPGSNLDVAQAIQLRPSDSR